MWALVFGAIWVSALSLSASASAAELIVNQAELKELRDRVGQGPLYRFRFGVFRKRVSRHEIGQPMTPFFREEGRAQVVFRKNALCFRVEVGKVASFVKPSRCDEVSALEFRLAEYPEFRQIAPEDAASLLGGPVVYEERSEEVQWNAYVHTRRMIEWDRAIFRGQRDRLVHPIRPFSIQIRFRTEVAPGLKGGLEIHQESEIKADAISILPQKKKREVVEFRSGKNDLFFVNPHGEIILFRSLLSWPFQSSLLWFPESYWAEIQERALRSEYEPVCYRDGNDAWSHEDCHALVFGGAKRGIYHTFMLLKISPAKREIEILQ